MSQVSSVITNTDLSEFSIYGGDCVNIAVALQHIFGGELVASYANEVDFTDGKPAHTAVRINGTLYDGGGKTSEASLRDRAHYGISDQNWEDIIVTTIPSPDRKLHNPARVEQLVTQFEETGRDGIDAE